MSITHKAGELIGLSSGEYSDYRFNGLYRLTVDCNLAEFAQAYYAQAPGQSWDAEQKDVSDSGFGAYLIANGIAEELDYDEVHCGSYDFEVEEIVSSMAGRLEKFAEPQG